MTKVRGPRVRIGRRVASRAQPDPKLVDGPDLNHSLKPVHDKSNGALWKVALQTVALVVTLPAGIYSTWQVWEIRSAGDAAKAQLELARAASEAATRQANIARDALTQATAQREAAEKQAGAAASIAATSVVQARALDRQVDAARSQLQQSGKLAMQSATTFVYLQHISEVEFVANKPAKSFIAFRRRRPKSNRPIKRNDPMAGSG